MDAIENATRIMAKRQADAMDKLCEQAIQSGSFGVLVHIYYNGTIAGLSDRVPYGTIHERRHDSYMPSEQSS